VAASTEWLTKDYYAVLGVSEHASQQEITKAYRKLARQLHPDANPDDKQAEERFKEVSAAYDVIGDPAKRAEYDETRRLARASAAPFGFGTPGATRVRVHRSGDVPFAGFDASGFDGFDDVFGTFFGARRPRGRTRARAGADLTAAVQLTFRDAVTGTTTEVPVIHDSPCQACGGSGAAPGGVRSCPTCSGSGMVGGARGSVTIAQTCPACCGTGRQVTESCSSCSGTGARTTTTKVKVRIPAGVEDGALIRLPGRGEPGGDGGPPGDLYVRVHVSPDSRFARRGDDLVVTVPVSYPEAVLGAKIPVPTLDGGSVTVRVPPGTPSGRVLRVRGHGVHRDGHRGDLLVTVEVAVPKKLSRKERKAVEELAAAMDWSPRDDDHRRDAHSRAA
jgi:molecular chaperone DnaJ